ACLCAARGRTPPRGRRDPGDVLAGAAAATGAGHPGPADVGQPRGRPALRQPATQPAAARPGYPGAPQRRHAADADRLGRAVTAAGHRRGAEMEPGVNERIEQMLRSFRQTRQKLSELNARARETQGWAASRDNLITCTVPSGAGITDLTISPRALERYDAATLADTIRGVIAEANAQL